jgi:hypothetical protein
MAKPSPLQQKEYGRILFLIYQGHNSTSKIEGELRKIKETEYPFCRDVYAISKILKSFSNALIITKGRRGRGCKRYINFKGIIEYMKKKVLKNNKPEILNILSTPKLDNDVCIQTIKTFIPKLENMSFEEWIDSILCAFGSYFSRDIQQNKEKSIAYSENFVRFSTLCQIYLIKKTINTKNKSIILSEIEDLPFFCDKK